MARRILVDPEGLTATLKPHRAERKGVLLCLIDILNRDVEMHLLWWVGVRPARRLQIGRQLERQAGTVGRITDDDPVVVILHPNEAEQFLIERRQPTRVRGVDYKAVPPATHSRSMSSWPTGLG